MVSLCHQLLLKLVVMLCKDSAFKARSGDFKFLWFFSFFCLNCLKVSLEELLWKVGTLMMCLNMYLSAQLWCWNSKISSKGVWRSRRNLRPALVGSKRIFSSSQYAADFCLYSTTGVQRRRLPLIVCVRWGREGECGRVTLCGWATTASCWVINFCGRLWK